MQSRFDRSGIAVGAGPPGILICGDRDVAAVALGRWRTGRQTNAIVRTAALGAAVLAEIRVRRGSSDCRLQIDEPDCGASPRRRGAFSLLAGRRRRDGFWIRVAWA